MATKTYSYMGKGMIYLRARSGEGGLMPVGNCSALEFAVETDSVSQPDYTSPGGGNANEIDRVSSVGINMTMLELRPTNLAMALRGTASSVEGTAHTGEAHVGYPGALVAFDFTPDTTDTSTIVVTLDPAGTATTAVEGEDYDVTRAGIIIKEGGAITAGSELEVDYTSLPADVVEAMTEAGNEYELIFDGLNEAENGRPVTVRVHRVKWSPTSGLSLIGDEFAELPLEGSVLSDNTVVGAGLSRYFKVSQAHAAA